MVYLWSFRVYLLNLNSVEAHNGKNVWPPNKSWVALSTFLLNTMVNGGDGLQTDVHIWNSFRISPWKEALSSTTVHQHHFRWRGWRG